MSNITKFSQPTVALVIGKCYDYFELKSLVKVKGEEGECFDPSKMTSEQAQKARDLIAECNQVDPSSKSKQLSGLKNTLVVLIAGYSSSVYHARSEIVNLDSARQSKIETKCSVGGSPFPIGKGDEKDRFGEVAASPNSQFLTARGISPPPTLDSVMDNCHSFFEKESFQIVKNKAGQNCIDPSKITPEQARKIAALIKECEAIDPQEKNKEIASLKNSLTKLAMKASTTEKTKASAAAAAPPTFEALYDSLAEKFNAHEANKLLDMLDENHSGIPRDVINERITAVKFLIEANISAHTYRNPFESSLPPVGIVNKGNTCFAAAWMQLVSMNTLLSGAYESLLLDPHPAKNVLKQYKLSQKSRQSVDNIVEMRTVFRSISDNIQQDAVELSRRICDVMRIPSNGKIVIDGTPVVFGHEKLKFISDGSFRPCSTVQGSKFDFPVLELQRPGQPNPTLDDLLTYNLSEDAIYFAQMPNIFLCNIGRLEDQPLRNQPVELPLYYKIPDSRKMEGLSEEFYTLQGFLSHSGTVNGGALCCLPPMAGKVLPG